MPPTHLAASPLASAPDWLTPVLLLLLVVGLAYLGMWRGWRARAGRHELPPLLPPAVGEDGEAAEEGATLVAEGRYFGTTTAGRWLDRVVAHGLGARSQVTLALSRDGLDVVRPAAGFRVPATALRGARQDRGIAGKVVPPHGVLVVTWQHGDLLLDSGFRLDPAGSPHAAWVQAIERLVRPEKEHCA